MDIVTFNGVKEVISRSRNARRNASLMTVVMDVFFLCIFFFVIPLSYRNILIFLIPFSATFWIISYFLTYVSIWGWGGKGITVNMDLTDTRVWTLNDWLPGGQYEYQAKMAMGMLEVDDEGLRLLVFLKWNGVESVKKMTDTQIMFTKKSWIPALSSLFGLSTLVLQFKSSQDQDKFIDIARHFVNVEI
jgi:hypothetical protein